jgi:hypothetical protein
MECGKNWMRFFYWRIFAKFRPEFRGFFMEKKKPKIRQISKKNKSKSPDFYDKL